MYINEITINKTTTEMRVGNPRIRNAKVISRATLFFQKTHLSNGFKKINNKIYEYSVNLLDQKLNLIRYLLLRMRTITTIYQIIRNASKYVNMWHMS
jgi:hypothetical protein